MRFHLIFLLFLLVFGIACKQQKQPVVAVQTINLTQSNDALPISSFIDELDYLELKASDANIEIGEIQDIKVLAGDIIIRQRKAAEKSIIRFSKNGDFICEIVNNKNEKVIDPVDIIEYRKDYAVLGENGIHLISKKGEYKKRLVSGKMAGQTFFTTKNNFLLISENPSGEFLSEYGLKKRPKSFIKHNERINKWIYTDISRPKKNEHHLISSFCDTIFAYRNTKLLPKYILDGGVNPTLSDVWGSIDSEDPKEIMRTIYDTDHVLVRNFLENEDIIFITYWVGSAPTTAIIKKENWEIRYYSQAVNDIDGGIWDKPMYLSPKNELYVPISSYKIEGHKISNKWHKDFEKIQKQMSSNKNPVLMRCHLE